MCAAIHCRRGDHSSLKSQPKELNVQHLNGRHCVLQRHFERFACRNRLICIGTGTKIRGESSENINSCVIDFVYAPKRRDYTVHLCCFVVHYSR